VPIWKSKAKLISINPGELSSAFWEPRFCWCTE